MIVIRNQSELKFVKSNSTGDWQYIALYGKQALSNDNAGIVLFYKNSSLIEQNDDELNYFVKLKPNCLEELRFNLSRT